MAASICSDIFTITAVVNLNCTLTIADEHRTQGLTGYGSHSFTIPFTYVVGTEPVPTHANYGFSIRPASPSGAYPVGITVTGTFANGGAVDITGDANSIKMSSVAVTVVIAASVSERLSFDVRVQLNTGT